uniref:Reverse transcriptase domain-containing protein n=1 Tax=Solanum lycopersicum TaxID=4081 RepID=A0A3Q7IW09_SOLLC
MDNSGHNYISIAPEYQEKITFTCLYGTFAFRRMSFGLCNAPATFQRCMMSIFSDMVEDTIEVLMDDFSLVGLRNDDEGYWKKTQPARPQLRIVDRVCAWKHLENLTMCENTDVDYGPYFNLQTVWCHIHGVQRTIYLSTGHRSPP